MSNDFDQACRSLLKMGESARAVLWLIGSRPEDVRFEGWLDARRVAWPGEPDRTSDSVAKVTDEAAGGAPFLIVIEFQIDPDAKMLGRLLEYMGRLLNEFKPTDLPGDRYGVLAVVVNLRGKGDCSRDMRLTSGRPGLFTALGVAEWNLQEEDAEATLEAIARGEVPRVALAWLPLMRGGQDGKIIPRWLQVAESETDPEIRKNLGIAVLFAEAAGCLDVWENGLKGWNVMHSKVVEQWTAKARQEGRHEERLDIIFGFISRRFGSVPEDIRQKVIEADQVTLGRVLEVAPTGSLEQIRDQLSSR